MRYNFYGLTTINFHITLKIGCCGVVVVSILSLNIFYGLYCVLSLATNDCRA
jgi:hypothetical protein